MSQKGIYAAAVTPVDNRGAVSLERYCRHARWLLRNGCHGIGVFGSTSETSAFSVKERQEALDAYIKEGLPAQAMTVGIGCCAISDTVALAKHALDHGITNLLALPPFFYKSNLDEGLIRAFAEIIERTGDERMCLLLYHFPQQSGVPITKPVIQGVLERFPNTLVGIKDSSGDWDHTHDLIKSFPSLAIYSGADTHLLKNLRAGGAGTISAAANINCEASRAAFNAWQNGNTAEAEKAMTLVANVRAILQRYPLVPAVKHVIADGQHDEVWSWVRPPLVELDGGGSAELLRELDAAGYAYDPNLCTVASA